MWQRCGLLWSKRTPGYVFWRQSTLVELQNVKRSYLLSERPLPIAEVARRMARVRARYEATTDYRERVLLRGEYKYFSGKPIDMQACRVADPIALLQCSGFFGFWDTAQVNRALAELLRRFNELSASEMCTLFVSLPKLRKRDGEELFVRLADALADVVPQLTVDQCLMLCTVAEPEATPLPDALLHNVLLAISLEVDTLTVAQCVQTIDVLCAASHGVRSHFDALFRALRSSVSNRVSSLTPLDTASLYYNLIVCDVCEGALEVQLLRQMVTNLSSTCARSVAMLFSAIAASTQNSDGDAKTYTSTRNRRESHSDKEHMYVQGRCLARQYDTHGSLPCTESRVGLWLTMTRALAERVVFLATDFTPTELLSVLPVYLSSLVMIGGVTHTMAHVSHSTNRNTDASAHHDAADKSTHGGGPRSHKSTASRTVHTSDRNGAGIDDAQSSSHAHVSRVAEPGPHFHRSSNRVSHEAVEQEATLRHVVRQLTEQLLVLLDNPAAYFSLAQLLEVLRMYASVVEELSAQIAGGEAGACRALHDAAHTKAVLRLLSGKLVAQMPHCPWARLVSVLQLVDTLHSTGQVAVDDAVVAAAMRELMRREVNVGEVESVAAMADALSSLHALRPVHQAQLSQTIVPKIRAACL